jgi:hypothetical protein
MISDDWNGLDTIKFREVLDDLVDFALMNNIEPIGQNAFMLDFVHKVELIRDKQLKEANKNIPAILRK